MTQEDRGLAFVGRALMALLFVVSGVRKVLGFAGTVGYFSKLGIPLPEAVAAITVVIEIGGGILLLVGWRQAIVAAAMPAFTIGTALIGHRFWAVTDPQAYAAQLNNFLKNLAIAGGLLMVVVDGRRGGRR